MTVIELTIDPDAAASAAPAAAAAAASKSPVLGFAGGAPFGLTCFGISAGRELVGLVNRIFLGFGFGEVTTAGRLGVGCGSGATVIRCLGVGFTSGFFRLGLGLLHPPRSTATAETSATASKSLPLSLKCELAVFGVVPRIELEFERTIFVRYL